MCKKNMVHKLFNITNMNEGLLDVYSTPKHQVSSKIKEARI